MRFLTMVSVLLALFETARSLLRALNCHDVHSNRYREHRNVIEGAFATYLDNDGPDIESSLCLALEMVVSDLRGLVEPSPSCEPGQTSNNLKFPPGAVDPSKPPKKKAHSPSAAQEKKPRGVSPIIASLNTMVDTCPAKKEEAGVDPAGTTRQAAPSGSTMVTSAASKESIDVPAPSSEPAAAGTPSIAASTRNQAACPPKEKREAAAPAEENAKGWAGPGAAPSAIPSAEDASRIRGYATLREKYVARARELSGRPGSDDFEEESLSLADAEGLPVLEKSSLEVGEEGEFPDALLTHLLLILQGRSLPLSNLAAKALDELSPFVRDARPLTIESISSRIKLLAQRKSYMCGKPPTSASKKPTQISKLDCFENAEECYMWRWELSSIDLLPQKEANKVKKARTARKKLLGHHKAIFSLISAIDKAMVWLQNSASRPSNAAAGQKLVAKVSDIEEKVLKFEREEEKARLLKEAKVQKQKNKETKEREKKRKEEEKEQKKLEAAKEHEETKRKKNEEKEQEKLKKEQESLKKEEKDRKRKARMMSFFSKGNTKKQKVAADKLLSKDVLPQSSSSFNSYTFWKQIDSREEHLLHPLAELSKRSREIRQRRRGKVRVSVLVTVLSENAFAPQPYDEERVIVVPNRYKFLGFHEDVRPPYRGTWSKKSDLVTGRRPCGKDTKYLDYENDSEAEWEEGDDEEGEDLQEDGDYDTDEEEDHNDEDNDGWLAAEGDLGIEDDDDETRELRKKNASFAKHSHLKACVVAPRFGGLSHEKFDDSMHCVIEGFSTPQDALDVLNSHVGSIITPDVSICLDAFPPSDTMKEASSAKRDKPAGSSQSKEISLEAQKTMAKFVHNSTQFKSKDNLVTELLKAHPDISNSRAQAVRELNVIAKKRRLANGVGVVWEVKADRLKNLELTTKDLKNPPKESPPSTSPGGGGKEKTDPNAPKRNMPSFILYSNATRTDVKAADPDAGFCDIAQILSNNFKALNPEKRALWNEKAVADKDRYQREMANNLAKTASVSSSEEAETNPYPEPTANGQGNVPLLAGKKRKKSNDASVGMANLFAKYLQMSNKPKAA